LQADSFDNEHLFVDIDNQRVYVDAHAGTTGTQQCGGDGTYFRESTIDIDVVIPHSGSTVTIAVSSDLDAADALDESYGVQKASVWVSDAALQVGLAHGVPGPVSFPMRRTGSGERGKGPVLGAVVTLGAAPLQTAVDQDFSDGNMDGWAALNTYAGRALNITTCGKYGQILGGYQQTGTQALITKCIADLPAHTELFIAMDLLAVDSFDSERIYVLLDGVQVQLSSFEPGRNPGLCHHRAGCLPAGLGERRGEQGKPPAGLV
jgi:carrier protein